MEGTVGVRVPCQVEIECKAAKSGFRREMQILERLELHSGAGFGEASLLTSELRYILYIYIYILYNIEMQLLLQKQFVILLQCVRATISN